MNDMRTPGNLFLSFFSEPMIEELVLHTNERISEERDEIGDNNRNNATYSNTSINEMKALIATLLVAGARNDSHTSSMHMFEKLFAVAFYRHLFSEKRWTFILRCLRMDDANARTGQDKFEHIRNLWEMLMTNCKNNWEAGNIFNIFYLISYNCYLFSFNCYLFSFNCYLFSFNCYIFNFNCYMFCFRSSCDSGRAAYTLQRSL